MERTERGAAAAVVPLGCHDDHVVGQDASGLGEHGEPGSVDAVIVRHEDPHTSDRTDEV
jgi:hypothetical protein